MCKGYSGIFESTRMIFSVCIVNNGIGLEHLMFQHFFPYVQPEKQIRILRQKIKQNADNMLIGEILAKYMIWEKFRIPFSGQCFSYGKYGKPYLKGFPHVHFNISHSGKFVACAVSEKPVGIDIQKIVPSCMAAMDTFFSEEEREQVETSEDSASAFTKIWTQKEAYLKMLGIGVGMAVQVEGKSPVIQTKTLRYENAFLSVALGEEE